MANGLWCGCVNDEITRRSVNQARVTVTDPATTELVGLFKDREGTKPLGNPFLTREDGKIKFYARAGRVNISVYKNGSSANFENEIIADDWPVDAAPPGDPTASYLIVLNDASPRINSWEAPAMDNYAQITFGGTGDFTDIASSRDATRHVLAYHTTTPRWKLLDETFTDITPAVTLPGQCDCVAITPDGRYIALSHASNSPYFSVLDAQDGYSVKQPAVASLQPFSHGQLAFDADSQLLCVVGGVSPRVRLYDMPNCTLASTQIAAVSVPHYCAVFNEDSTWLACGVDWPTCLAIYDPSDGSVIATVPAIDWGIVAIDYSPTLGLLACGNADGGVFIVSTSTWTVVDMNDDYGGGGNGVTSVSFSVDETQLVATHNFSPFAVVYDMPGLVDTGFATADDVALDYAYVGIFVPRIT